MRQSSSFNPAQILNHLQHGRFSQAERLCRKRLKTTPNNHQVLHWLGAALLQQQQAAPAIEFFRRAVALAPLAAHYHSNLGEALRRTGQIDAGAISCRKALELNPDYVPARINLGCCLLQLKQPDEALATFQQALKQAPQDGRLHGLRADALRELGRLQEARDAYQQALRKNPDDAHAHTNLGPLLLALGQWHKALEHCQCAVGLTPEDGTAYMNLGRCLIAMEQLEEAMDAYATAYQHMPQSATLRGNIGKVWLETGDLAQAEAWLCQALEIEPDNIENQVTLALIWLEQKQEEKAQTALEDILERAPDHYEAHLGIAQALWENGDADGALRHYQTAAALRPEIAGIHAKMGGVLASAGKMQEAEAAQRRALVQNPSNIAALNGLATSLRGKLGADDSTRMLALLQDPLLRDGARASLHNGLAYYYDGIKDYAAAAQHVEQGNALYWRYKTQRGWDYDPEDYERHITALIETYSTDFFRRTAGFGDDSAVPVFVVGMPRSGTTLTEQILASHPHVLGVGECPFAMRGFSRLPWLMGNPESTSLDCLADLTPVAVQTSAAWHLDKLAKLRLKSGRTDIRRIVDKMPDNYSQLGWLTTLFPNAKLIYVRRDPRDIAVSCWMTQFGQIQWACHQDHIATRLMQHKRIMRHWQAVLPVPILTVDYEQLVTDPEAQIRRLLDFIGLPWAPACLDFHRNDNLVRTASVSQVRQPLYQKSVEKWRGYNDPLTPLFTQLAAADMH
ncbi:MAG: tetratricopeptide repeat protein [Methylovulum sp.]|nr:tetratricopeptide repeat protein [Methylovulum sp.]